MSTNVNNVYMNQRKQNSNNNNHHHLNTFKTLLWNCNRFVNKEVLFNRLIKKEKPDIIALVELKCNHAEARYYLSMLNYSGNHDDYEILFSARDVNPEFGGGALRCCREEA
jgi:hypothetical protein